MRTAKRMSALASDATGVFIKLLYPRQAAQNLAPLSGISLRYVDDHSGT
jgi:hypothetical protein